MFTFNFFLKMRNFLDMKKYKKKLIFIVILKLDEYFIYKKIVKLEKLKYLILFLLCFRTFFTPPYS